MKVRTERYCWIQLFVYLAFSATLLVTAFTGNLSPGGLIAGIVWQILFMLKVAVDFANCGLVIFDYEPGEG